MVGILVLLAILQISFAAKDTEAYIPPSQRIKDAWEEVKEFFGDVLSALQDLMGYTPSKTKTTKKNAWSFNNIVKYSMKRLSKGYKMIINTLDDFELSRGAFGPLIPSFEVQNATLLELFNNNLIKFVEN